MEAKGLGRDLLDHTNVLQTDFFDMLKKLKEHATELHNQRILRIKHPEFNKNSMQVVQKQTGKANQLHNRLLDRLESDFKDYNNLELRYVFGMDVYFFQFSNRNMQQGNKATKSELTFFLLLFFFFPFLFFPIFLHHPWCHTCKTRLGVPMLLLCGQNGTT